MVEDFLIVEVLTAVQQLELESMGIFPPRESTQILTVKFQDVRYILTSDFGSRIKLISGEEFFSRQDAGQLFAAWAQWQGRNPGR